MADRTYSNIVVMGIKPKFIDKLLDGSKLHTIRPGIQRAGWKIQVGDVIHFYKGSYRKKREKIAEKTIVRIEPIKLYDVDYTHPIDLGRIPIGLNDDDSREFDLFARNDGFKNYSEFMDFFGMWEPTFGSCVIFEGFCIFWDHTDAY